MQEVKSSYKSIFKAFSLLGGGQVINIVISIIRTKVIAVLLGAFGMGISGVFISSISLIRNFTDFGIGMSGVKDVSKAAENKNKEQLSFVISLIRKLVWVTGVLGVLVVIVFSKKLSLAGFQNEEYTLSFVLLSIVLLFYQLTAGEIIVLQGLSKLKEIVKVQVSSGVIGLIITLPFYFFLKIKGIVIAIILSSIINYFCTRYYSRKINIEKVRIQFKNLFKEGSVILKLGLYLSISILLSKLVEYLIRIYIIYVDGISHVGLYNAGFSLVNTYVVIFFSSIISDFYPRLSAKVDKVKEFSEIIINQTEILILLISPFLILCLLIVDWLVLLLYSRDFLSVSPLVQWLILAMYIKITSWLLGYLILAKNDTKFFLYTQVLKNILELILSILMYKYFGLIGLGISFFTTLLIMFLVLIFVSKKKYHFVYSFEVKKIFLFQFFLGISSFILLFFFKNNITILIVILLFLISFYYSYVELNTRLKINETIRKIINKNKF